MKASRLLAAALSLSLTLGAGAAHAAPKGSPWGANYFPNVTLVTHEGKEVKLYDDLIQDKLVVFSFIYTHCTKQCGLITASLVRVQRELGARMGKDIHFYSVSLDPERDTPEVLAAYAKNFRAGPGWTFLTGKPEDIQLIRKKFGDLESVEEHTANLNIGNDRTGQWMATGAVDNPKYLATVIGDWLDPAWDKRKPINSYADAPKVVIDPAGDLFRKKCLSCHMPNGDSVGPKLEGVVSARGRGWVSRWLKAPEKLYDEKDPVAVSLVARHGDVLMPNLDLSDEEVATLVDHLEKGRHP